MIADLSRMEDTHRLARQLLELDEPIDVLIHNAGIYRTVRGLNAESIELVFAVNYLSSFVLNYLLMEKLKSQESERILLVNSEGHRFAPWGLRLDDLNWEKRFYTGLRSYGSSKTAQLLTMMIFDDYFSGRGVTINAMHPGSVKTEAGRDNGPLYTWFKHHVMERNFRSPEVSSETPKGISGRFLNLTTEEEPAPPALDREVARELWDISLRMGGLLEES